MTLLVLLYNLADCVRYCLFAKAVFVVSRGITLTFFLLKFVDSGEKQVSLCLRKITFRIYNFLTDNRPHNSYKSLVGNLKGLKNMTKA